jgi:hypothetical protein
MEAVSLAVFASPVTILTRLFKSPAQKSRSREKEIKS